MTQHLTSREPGSTCQDYKMNCKTNSCSRCFLAIILSDSTSVWRDGGEGEGRRQKGNREGGDREAERKKDFLEGSKPTETRSHR